MPAITQTGGFSSPWDPAPMDDCATAHDAAPMPRGQTPAPGQPPPRPSDLPQPADPALSHLILATLTAIAPEVDGVSLDPDRAFRDQIELDSVDFLNFVLALEQRLGRRIPEIHYPRLSSLQGCLDYLDATPR